jgi:hypothetical protein
MQVPQLEADLALIMRRFGLAHAGCIMTELEIDLSAIYCLELCKYACCPAALVLSGKILRLLTVSHS